MNYSGKKLMVLGGSFEHLKLVEAALEMGLSVYVADYYQTSPAKEIATKAFNLDISDIDALVDVCRKEKVDGVLSTSIDFCMPRYQAVCKKLGLPYFGGALSYEILSNKDVFKRTCRQYGIGTPREYSSNVDDWSNQGRLPFEVFVKPASRSGSQGAEVCSTYEEVRTALERARSVSLSGEAVVESNMKGYDGVTVTLYFENGIPFVERIADIIFSDEADGLGNVTAASKTPSKYTTMYFNSVHRRLVQMLKGIGVTQGPVFFQAFVDDDDFYFYDPGRRFPGVEYERAFKKATGIDVLKKSIAFALDGRVSGEFGSFREDSYLLNGMMSLTLFLYARAGIIAEMRGFDVIAQMEEVVFLAEIRGTGVEIMATGDTRQRVAQVMILADGINAIRDVVKRVYELVTVLDERGEDMLVSKIDPESIR